MFSYPNYRFDAQAGIFISLNLKVMRSSEGVYLGRDCFYPFEPDDYLPYESVIGYFDYEEEAQAWLNQNGD